jgi:hypothetical protein
MVLFVLGLASRLPGSGAGVPTGARSALIPEIFKRRPDMTVIFWNMQCATGYYVYRISVIVCFLRVIISFSMLLALKSKSLLSIMN